MVHLKNAHRQLNEGILIKLKSTFDLRNSSFFQFVYSLLFTFETEKVGTFSLGPQGISKLKADDF